MMKFLSNKLVKSLSLVFFTGLTVTTHAQTFNWSPAGPIYTAGRARNMLVDKSDPSGNTLYVGSTTSGIFKSADGGQNWAPLNDQATVRNISYLAQAADNTIFVGTGEGFLRPSQKAKAQPGTGLYKLVGSALTQINTAANTSTIINRIACHPTNPNILAISTQSAVLFSVDGGSTFITAGTGTFTGMGQDVKFDGLGNLYFSIGPIDVSSPVSSTVWKSNGPLNASSAFANITPTAASVPSPNFGRIELAVAPSNPNVVYASCANKYNFRSSPTLAGLFVTYDAGSNWGIILVGSAQLDPLSNGGTLASGDYAHTILVSSSNQDQLLMGGYLFYTFIRTGGTNSSPSGTWLHAGSPFALNSQFYLHENIHDIKVIGSNPTKFYFVTDAGIFRSIDLNSGNFAPSFQPFYKGLITGQFNSVSIDRYPGASGTTTSQPGTSITPYQTYIGGTGGNGLTYFNGSYPLVSQELSYESGDIFNSEYSKILPSAAYFSSSSGSLFRTADVKTGNSNLVDWVVNTKKQDVQSFTNSTYSIAGTPFKLWENLGSYPTTPDSLVFYNDTAIARSSIPTGSLTTATSFSFSIGRPQPTAIIDYITVRAGTVVVASTPSQVAVNPSSGLNTKTITITMNPTYTVSPTSTVSYVAPIASVNGYTGAASSFSVILNPNYLDQIYISLAGPLYTVMPSASPAIPAGGAITDYMRVTATVYYRYPAGSVIKVVDNSISTKSSTLTTNTPTSGVLSWSNPVTVGNSTVAVINPVLKLATGQSARLAVPYGNSTAGYSIRVSNSPLDLNTPLSFVTVSQNKCRTDDSFGNATTNTVNVLGKPTVLEWAKSGKYLYYATEAGTVNCLYRVSHLNTLIDSTAKGYNGKLHTNIFNFNTLSTPNPRSPYRTTPLGYFTNKITSISVTSNDSLMVLTFDDPSPTGTLVMASTNDIRFSDSSNIQFKNKTPLIMSQRKTYCSLIEKSDIKQTFVGTDNGVFYTSDITASSPIWKNVDTLSSNAANWLPKVQIFDMKQQTLEPWNCYNSGQIYVATNGRGIWTNSNYFTPMVISINENPKTATTENNLTLYPNPTNGNVNISFNGVSGETAKITVYDVNGRIVKTEELGKIYSSEVNYTFETSNIATGLYIINVSSDAGIKRVAKLVVTK